MKHPDLEPVLWQRNAAVLVECRVMQLMEAEGLSLGVNIMARVYAYITDYPRYLACRNRWGTTVRESL